MPGAGDAQPGSRGSLIPLPGSSPPFPLRPQQVSGQPRPRGAHARPSRGDPAPSPSPGPGPGADCLRLSAAAPERRGRARLLDLAGVRRGPVRRGTRAHPAPAFPGGCPPGSALRSRQERRPPPAPGGGGTGAERARLAPTVVPGSGADRGRMCRVAQPRPVPTKAPLCWPHNC